MSISLVLFPAFNLYTMKLVSIWYLRCEMVINVFVLPNILGHKTVNTNSYQQRYTSYTSFFSLKLVWTVFASSSYDLASASIVLSHVIAESSIIPDKYFSLSQLHLTGFQVQSFSHKWRFLHSHEHYLYFTIDLNYIFSIKSKFTFAWYISW